MSRARHHRMAAGRHAVIAHEFTGWGARRDGPAVLVVHGWGARSEHMRVVIEALLARRMRVVALDLPGHGASSGRSLNMAEALDAVHAVSVWLGPFTAAIGHSFGGTVALNAAAGTVQHVPAVPFERLATIAAPDAMPALFAGFGKAIGLGPRSQAALEARVAAVTGNRLDTFVGARLLRRLRLPTLLVHAPDDKEVPLADARTMASAGDHVRLVTAPGLGHRRILGDAALAGRLAAFAAGEATAGSGARRPALALCSPNR